MQVQDQEFKGQTQLHSKFEAIWSYMRLCFKTLPKQLSFLSLTQATL